MAAQKGSAMLLKIDQSGTQTTVGGLRSTSITFNDEAVDITNKDSLGMRTLLAGGGTQSVSISGSGVFTDSTTEQAVRTAYFAQANTSDGSAAQTAAFDSFQVIVPDLGTFTGTFMIATMGYSGEFNGEVTYDLTLESSGYVTFA
jgi:TP901-1 family phage major tail protein